MKNIFDSKPNDRMRIISLNCDSTIKRRLIDLGICEEAVIECVFKSPWSDPCAYMVKGSVIALRKEIAENILCESEECL